MAASAARSPTESRTAPKTDPPPRARASAPSSMSSSTKTVTANAPQKRCPVPMPTTADTTAPTVPVIVTMSGVTPARLRRTTTGAQKRATAGRALLPSTSGLLDRYGGARPGHRQQPPRLAEHLRQHPGEADDR